MEDMRVKISKEFLDTLKQVYDINCSVKIKKGEREIRVRNASGDMFARFIIDEEFPKDFVIYDISKFLPVVSIIKEPYINLSNDNYMEIQNFDASQNIRYITRDESYVTAEIEEDKFEQLLNKFTLMNTVEVEESQFASVLKAANTLKLDYIGISNDENDVITMSAFNQNVGGDEKMMDSYDIELGEYESDYDFTVVDKRDSESGKFKLAALSKEGKLEFQLMKEKVFIINTENHSTFVIGASANKETTKISER